MAPGVCSRSAGWYINRTRTNPRCTWPERPITRSKRYGKIAAKVRLEAADAMRLDSSHAAPLAA
eukprot:15056201-Alexandrium_andersonii.AAC.1